MDSVLNHITGESFRPDIREGTEDAAGVHGHGPARAASRRRQLACPAATAATAATAAAAPTPGVERRARLPKAPGPASRAGAPAADGAAGCPGRPAGRADVAHKSPLTALRAAGGRVHGRAMAARGTARAAARIPARVHAGGRRGRDSAGDRPAAGRRRIGAVIRADQGNGAEDPGGATRTSKC